MSVCVIGLGYIGLPTAALIAGKGIAVTGVDVNKKVVETVNRGEIHIVETDLGGLVRFVVGKGQLVAARTVPAADVFLIAVPTPFLHEPKKAGGAPPSPDLSFVVSAVRSVIPRLKKGALVILESTSPVGTTEKIYRQILKERPELEGNIFVAYCPERVLPGKILYELEHNDRVIGGLDRSSAEKAKEFYSLFVKGNIYITNARTAEMCKLVENAYRDVNIAFANELSLICDRAGINVWELIELASRHPRVRILQPGPGVGGHCIAVDPWFIVSEFTGEAELIRTAREVNINKTEWVMKKIQQAASEFSKKSRRSPRIACMGLAYKPDIDDLRESPALLITKRLISGNHRVIAAEPNIEAYDGIDIAGYEEAVEKADMIVFLVAHRQFKGMKIPKNKKVLDFCGVSR